MKTRVVHIRDSGKDKELEVYIGRSGKGKKGLFGNPVIPGRKCSVCGNVHQKGGDTLQCYKVYLDERIETDKEFAGQLAS